MESQSFCRSAVASALDIDLSACGSAPAFRLLKHSSVGSLSVGTDRRLDMADGEPMSSESGEGTSNNAETGEAKQMDSASTSPEHRGWSQRVGRPQRINTGSKPQEEPNLNVSK
jgi:hypothetical protein